MAKDSKEDTAAKTDLAPLHLQITKEQKHKIRIAAAVKGVTMTDFVMDRAFPDAEKITEAL